MSHSPLSQEEVAAAKVAAAATVTVMTRNL